MTTTAKTVTNDYIMMKEIKRKGGEEKERQLLFLIPAIRSGIFQNITILLQ